MHTPPYLGFLLPAGEGQDEGRFLRCLALTPALSRGERGKSDAHYLAIGSVRENAVRTERSRQRAVEVQAKVQQNLWGPFMLRQAQQERMRVSVHFRA